MEAQRQSLGGRAERLQLEIRQTQDDADKERQRLLMQIQALSGDLDMANNQVRRVGREVRRGRGRELGGSKRSGKREEAERK